jgi:hypothetical protein
MQAWRMARVHYLPAHAEMVVARITSWAAMGDPVSRGPGLDQGDATQFAAHMAYLRHVCAFGPEWSKLAWFQNGTFLGVRVAGRFPAGIDQLQTAYGVPVLGEEPFRPSPLTSGNMGSQWSRQLALACDDVLRKVRDAEQASQVVPGWGGEFPGGAEPIQGGGGIGAAGIAIIVAGAAVGIIGTAAAWRYFDPNVRIEAASIAAAARAYEVRVRTKLQSGVDLPPSPIEVAQSERVREAANRAGNTNWTIGGAVVAGLGGGLTLGALLRSRLAS